MDKISTKELQLLKDEYLYELDKYTHEINDIEKIMDEKITTTLKEIYK